MPHVDQLYREFVQAWQAGEAPDPGDYLDRAAPAEQDGLAERLETFVMVAPSVEPTAARAAEIQASPAFLRAAALADDPAAVPWALRLQRARERAGLSLAELATRFVAAFELQGREERATALLGELESGERPATGVTRRAADRLAALLDLSPGALAPAVARPLFRVDDARRLDPGVSSDGPPPGFPAALSAVLDMDLSQWGPVDDLLCGGDDDLIV